MGCDTLRRSVFVASSIEPFEKENYLLVRYEP